jgi:hypothetical protein
MMGVGKVSSANSICTTEQNKAIVHIATSSNNASKIY